MVADGRVAHLRLTPEGERRLAHAFTELETQRIDLLDAMHHLEKI